MTRSPIPSWLTSPAPPTRLGRVVRPNAPGIDEPVGAVQRRELEGRREDISRVESAEDHVDLTGVPDYAIAPMSRSST